jgi:hypothetical protein
VRWLAERILPLELLPGLALVRYVEVREAWDGRLFTAETVRLVCSWFGG